MEGITIIRKKEPNRGDCPIFVYRCIITGVRLYLEGRKSDRLAIHLQHLSSVPKTLELSDDFGNKPNDEPIGKRLNYLMILVIIDVFSHVCTVPVDYNVTRINDSASIVTKAWFEVKGVGMKRVLFLRLGYSMVRPVKIRRIMMQIYVQSPKGLLQLASSLTEEKITRTKHISVLHLKIPSKT
ncbi:hypothetical protein Tco_0573707 [Tanacetum coccineum]